MYFSFHSWALAFSDVFVPILLARKLKNKNKNKNKDIQRRSILPFFVNA